MTSFTPFRTPSGCSPAGRLPLHAQTTDRATSIEVGHERNHLNNGSPDWKETGLRLSHSLGKYQQVNVGVVESRRFGLKDTQVLCRLHPAAGNRSGWWAWRATTATPTGCWPNTVSG